MDIKQLKYFLQVCKSKSLSKAAKELYITEQGLSKSVKSLENELHIPLFYRNGNGLDLTSYGIYLKDKSEFIVEEFERLKYSFEKVQSHSKKKIRVGYSTGTSAIFLWEGMLSLKKDYPEINIDILEYNGFFCDEAVYNGEVDLGVTVSPVDSSKFDISVIASKKICLLINKDRGISLNDLSEDGIKNMVLKEGKVIILNENYKAYGKVIEVCKKWGLDNDNVFATSDMELLTYMVRVNKAAGFGVNINEIPELIYIPFEDKSFSLDICLIKRKNLHMNESEKFFVNYMKNYYQNNI